MSGYLAHFHSVAFFNFKFMFSVKFVSSTIYAWDEGLFLCQLSITYMYVRFILILDVYINQREAQLTDINRKTNPGIFSYSWTIDPTIHMLR